MKRIGLLIYCLFIVQLVIGQEEKTPANEKDSFYLLSPVEVRAVRAGDNAPFAKTNLSSKDIQVKNIGQDIPFILNHTPSVVAYSDAGNGVGYTGIRIRGVDATRINITLNGIPYNDAESQGTFFVDIPDFSSSAQSIQVLRGVGTSSNGAGAFGASINFSTNEFIREAYGEFGYNYGSFNTWKNTVKTGTGLLYDHFTVDIRLSRIHSDGYIDRASSDLRSFYFSAAYIGKSSSIRANVILGKEKTYQAWYGSMAFPKLICGITTGPSIMQELKSRGSLMTTKLTITFRTITSCSTIKSWVKNLISLLLSFSPQEMDFTNNIKPTMIILITAFQTAALQIL
jgi:hypothetical protein